MFLTIFTVFLITEVSVGCQKQAVSFDMNEQDIQLERSSLSFSELPDCQKSKASIKLNLSKMGINNITDHFTDSPLFTCLNLEGNEIVTIPFGVFDDLPNLTYLNLANNHIPAYNLLSFGGHKKLDTLILDGNVPTYSHTFAVNGYFPELKSLFLRRNLLEYFPNDFRFHFPSLSHLYLTDNIVNVTNLYNFVSSMPASVTHLYLEQNGIRVFRTSVLNNITELYLDGNDFKNIDRSYENTLDPSNTPTMQELSLRYCKIEKVGATAFYGTYNLTTLDLSNNYIYEIPDGLFNGVSSLKNLSLSYNLLKEIPKAISLSCLKKLYLSHNKIQDVRQLSNLTGLRTLSLRGNNITHLNAGVFANLTNLKDLDLAENNIHYLQPDSLETLKGLTFLNLNFNKLSSVESLFMRNNYSLEQLYLKENPVIRITATSLINLPENLTVHMGPMRTSDSHPKLFESSENKEDNKSLSLEEEEELKIQVQR
ncbi:leucine-rich repeat-containing protein 15-like [Belonocnema kinseyi]|uniref:leucine-rich repeat-containing protein 15-like n=1 Tax=Belonocnema kinseyi TaxID=2817044 RepID=UPI00143DE108|nr:leucine-rich repeat-containing protein 15-like [Belonocnema kinseyi]